MKKLLVCLLALLLAALPALGESGGLRPRRDLEAASAAEDAPSDERLEGEGFASAEEAVTAYLEAMKSGDVAGMLSTFAIETYVENVNAQAYLWRFRAFVPMGSLPLPLGGEYQRQAAAASRYAVLADALYTQILALSWPEAYGEFDGRAVTFAEEEDVEAFLAEMAASDFEAGLREMEFIEFVSPAELSENYLSQNTLRSIAGLADAYGCDQLVDVAARIDIGGEEYCQFMQCARYGDRWYNLTQGGYLSNLMGVDAYSAGLIPASELTA